MKYFLFAAFFLIIIISGCAVLSAQRGHDGSEIESGNVCEGTGQGYRGPISVQVRMNGSAITEIVIIDSAEDQFVGGAAMEELSNMVIEYNSTDIDAISGATQTSRGFLEAVENAILNL